MRNKYLKPLFLLLGLLLFTGCSAQPTNSSASSAKTEPTAFPEASAEQSPVEESQNLPSDGWSTSTPEAYGMDSAKVAEFVQAANTQKGYNNFVIIKDGYIVAESYFGNDRYKQCGQVYSVTKSVVSMLFGIAMGEGKIESVDLKVLDCFPEMEFENVDENKQNMTLENLLTMTSGIQWGFGTADDPTMELFDAKDPVKFTLDRPMAAAPGEVFEYNNGNPEVLGAYIAQATGQSLQEYADAKLFGPMGITDYIWDDLPGSDKEGCCTGLRLTVRDMAKLGYLYLNNGRWNGQQLVPEEWVKTSTSTHTDTHGIGGPYIAGYGYLWWQDTIGCYSARGSYGQFIMVFPDENLVVAVQGFFAGATDGLNNDQLPVKMTQEYILPAIISNQALPENPEAYAQLQALCNPQT